MTIQTNVLTRKDFIKVAHAVCGEDLPRGWQKELSNYAHELGYKLSQPTISNLYRDEHKAITDYIAKALQAMSEAINSNRATSVNSDEAVTEEEVAVEKDSDQGKTDQEIKQEIAMRFSLFDECVQDVICGSDKACIISSPPGSGKSHTIEKYQNKAHGEVRIVTGGISPPEMFKVLYETRDNGVVVFDDCDDVFLSESGLNLLKGALDTKETRQISWLKSGKILDDDDNVIPKTFDFQGRVLFCTNKNFDKEIEKGTKMAPHFKALLSRCGYLSLGLDTERRRMLRIVQVCEASRLLSKNGAPFPFQQEQILSFIRQNASNFRELSLRLAVQIAQTMERHPDNWQTHVKAKFMKS